MCKRERIGVLALALLGTAGAALGGIPSAAYSSSTMAIQRVTGSGVPCSTCDLMWCPAGDMDLLLIRVTVRDSLETPVPDCGVRLELSGLFDPNNDLGSPTGVNGRICGAASRSDSTNAFGAVEFPIWGGGAGRYALHWIVTATCADPEIRLAANDDTLCIKSVDFRGAGAINFGDTFRYVPLLNAGHGYSGDLRFCSDANTVNFQDTFVYAVHLNEAHSCAGGAQHSFLLTHVSDGLLPACDELF